MEQGYSSTLSQTSALYGVGQRQAPTALPPGKTRYSLYRRLGGLQGRPGRVRKISPPPPGFDPRTAQSAASRYTDCDIPTHLYNKVTLKLLCKKKNECLDSIHMTLERRKWRALVNTVRNLRVQQNAGNFSAGRGTLKTTLFHGFR